VAHDQTRMGGDFLNPTLFGPALPLSRSVFDWSFFSVILLAKNLNQFCSDSRMARKTDILILFTENLRQLCSYWQDGGENQNPTLEKSHIGIRQISI
jgi:hypothetical protein